jgi:hypothetical protein
MSIRLGPSAGVQAGLRELPERVEMLRGQVVDGGGHLRTKPGPSASGPATLQPLDLGLDELDELLLLRLGQGLDLSQDGLPGSDHGGSLAPTAAGTNARAAAV